MQIDLGIASNVSMIATQGRGGEPILKYVSEFEIQFSMDGKEWVNITGDGTGIGTAQVREKYNFRIILHGFEI